MKKWNTDEIKKYANEMKWYQQIQLAPGLVTPGNVKSEERLRFLDPTFIKNKSVLDIGCNEGFYCHWAKNNNAKKVVGMDISEKKIEQARTVSEIMQLDLEFCQKSIFDIDKNVKYDVVFCFAVLTEIQDILNAIDILKCVTNKRLYLELALAKPLIYFSKSKFWIRGLLNKLGIRRYRGLTGILEMRFSKLGPVLSPSLRSLKELFGDEFKVNHSGKSIRYDMITIDKLK